MRDMPVVTPSPIISRTGTGPSIAAIAAPAKTAFWVLVTARANWPAFSGVGNGFDHVAVIVPF